MHILQTAQELEELLRQPSTIPDEADAFTDLARYVARCETALAQQLQGTRYVLGNTKLVTLLPRPNKPDAELDGAYSHPLGLPVLYTRTIESKRALAALLGNKHEGELTVVAPQFGNTQQPPSYKTTITSFSPQFTKHALQVSEVIRTDAHSSTAETHRRHA